VAEGVETTSQLDLLRSLRCDIYQGFLLARPMPAHQVEALLRRNSPAVEEQLNLVPSLA
jgi:EAL domain-containing protein (putative c-di-GMP-specific phosphodiesterase class I)